MCVCTTPFLSRATTITKTNTIFGLEQKRFQKKLQQNLIKSSSSNDMTVANDTYPIFDILTQILWNWKYFFRNCLFVEHSERIFKRSSVEYSPAPSWILRNSSSSVLSECCIFKEREIFSIGIKGSFPPSILTVDTPPLVLLSEKLLKF